MRIQSDFKDIYDNLVQDFKSDILYKRYSKYLKVDFNRQHFVNNGCLDLNVYLFGFCGKYKIFLHSPGGFGRTYSNAWNIEHIDKNLNEFIGGKDNQDYYSGIKRKYHYFMSDRYKRSYTMKLLDYDNFNMFNYLFEQAPIFIVALKKDELTCKNELYNVILNPKIENYEPFKWKNCFQFYQELEQYISNMAKPEPFVPIPDDITMRDIKGFDKYSFKNPSKKK
jgi:hypothetical protein